MAVSGLQLVWMSAGDNDIVGVFRIGNTDRGKKVRVPSYQYMIVSGLSDCGTHQQRNYCCIHLLLLIPLLSELANSPLAYSRTEDSISPKARIQGTLQE